MPLRRFLEEREMSGNGKAEKKNKIENLKTGSSQNENTKKDVENSVDSTDPQEELKILEDSSSEVKKKIESIYVNGKFCRFSPISY